MKIVKTSRILKLLAKDGWYLVHQVGSHRQFRHPTKKGKVTVNGKPSDDTWGNVKWTSKVCCTATTKS